MKGNGGKEKEGRDWEKERCHCLLLRGGDVKGGEIGKGKGERRGGKGREGERRGLCSCKNSLKYALSRTLPSCHSLCGSEVPWRINQGLNPQSQGLKFNVNTSGLGKHVPNLPFLYAL